MANFLQTPHRMFIQIMMGKKICSNEEVRRLHRLCHERTNTQVGDVKVFVEKINAAINPLNMAIKKGKDELSGDEYYILINTADNDLSRLNVSYKAKELELLKRIIINIVESENGAVSSSIALNNAEDVNITKKEADEIIARFKEDGWILEEGRGLCFSTRAIVELEHFLLTHYGDHVSRCFICKNVVLQGVCCASCDSKIHHHCKQTYFTQVTDNNKCPECEEPFQ